jgi:hypothetical protein
MSHLVLPENFLQQYKSPLESGITKSTQDLGMDSRHNKEVALNSLGDSQNACNWSAIVQRKPYIAHATISAHPIFTCSRFVPRNLTLSLQRVLKDGFNIFKTVV